MGSNRTPLVLAVIAAVSLACRTTQADITENLGMRILPCPGKVKVDGKFDDWDLSGGILTGSVRRGRPEQACWFHMMYDADNVYFLGRWFDNTPMNNPGSTAEDFGFKGDSLQVRFIMSSGTPLERVSHIIGWYGSKDKKDVVGIDYGRRFEEGKIADAQEKGARQVFVKSPDGKGYTQEVALPWKLLVAKGAARPKPGEKFQMSVQLNFWVGGRFRTLWYYDVFKRGVRIPVGTVHNAYDVWGGGQLEPKGNVQPWPVRMRGGRRFAVTMKDGLPVVNWNAPLVAGGLNNAHTIIEPPPLHPPPRLQVESEPIAGIRITGDRPGDTAYTALCKPDEAVSLSAPAHAEVAGKGYDFVCWKVDIDEGPDGLLKAEITMDMNHVATAMYEIGTYELTVQSDPITGVRITGDEPGVTNYAVTCAKDRVVGLVAPEFVSAKGKRYDFVCWKLDGAEKIQGLAEAAITITSDHTAVAVYETQETEAIGESDNTKLYAAIIAGGLILVALLGVVVIRLSARRR